MNDQSLNQFERRMSLREVRQTRDLQFQSRQDAVRTAVRRERLADEFDLDFNDPHVEAKLDLLESTHDEAFTIHSDVLGRSLHTYTSAQLELINAIDTSINEARSAIATNRSVETIRQHVGEAQSKSARFGETIDADVAAMWRSFSVWLINAGQEEYAAEQFDEAMMRSGVSQRIFCWFNPNPEIDQDASFKLVSLQIHLELEWNPIMLLYWLDMAWSDAYRRHPNYDRVTERLAYLNSRSARKDVAGELRELLGLELSNSDWENVATKLNQMEQSLKDKRWELISKQRWDLHPFLYQRLGTGGSDGQKLPAPSNIGSILDRILAMLH